MYRIKLCLILFFQITLLFGQKNFSFVYLPDIHLQPDSVVLAGFDQLAKQINKLRPDFVLTGGDMIYTAKNVNDKKAGILFDLMDNEFKKFRMPVYLTMGNHENVGITEESGIDKTNPMWGKNMYESRYTKRYYTFEFNGWKFFILDGIKILEKEKNYTQGVDSVQMEWIRNELVTMDKSVPVIISIHSPLINPHAISSSDSEALSANSAAILNMFRDYNLRMVLEGHTHLYMDLFFKGVSYVSGGSTAWGTDSADKGFLLVKIRKGIESRQFIRTSGADSQ
ncbi:MAG: metallophosphoesterase [Bacteroidales bacterium]